MSPNGTTRKALGGAATATAILGTRDVLELGYPRRRMTVLDPTPELTDERLLRRNIRESDICLPGARRAAAKHLSHFSRLLFALMPASVSRIGQSGTHDPLHFAANWLRT